MILVWKSVIAGEGPLCGIQTDESGWVIVQPSPTGSGTTMQVCVKQVPLHLNCPTGQAAAQQFDELLQSVVQKNSHEITTGAEALLLEDAVTEIDVIARKRKRARRAKQLSR
ncbi:hypothetical protein PHMEG_00016160 [Phytophthora megakarya]|uniref:Uncharacterized protein n=1 Tax=Phytophthora megakarya TaxID=4795 RepID=A0A225W110_9STRA|nr:hypothetical protein PHMEG_00016160 [Phytophthora megakarya]